MKLLLTMSLLCAPLFAATNVTMVWCPAPNYPSPLPVTNTFGGINDRGDVVGQTQLTDGFIRSSDGSCTLFRYPGSRDTFAHGINNAGMVAGTYSTANGTARGFVRNPDGTFVDYPNSNGIAAINSRGQLLSSEQAVWVIRDGAQTTPVVYPGATVTTAWGLNDFGEVAGSFCTQYTGSGGCAHSGGFLRTVDGRYIVIDSTGWQNSAAYGLNNRSDVVGQYSVPGDPKTHVFQRSADGSVLTVDGMQGVSGINNRGDILGTVYSDPDGASAYQPAIVNRTAASPKRLAHLADGFGWRTTIDFICQNWGKGSDVVVSFFDDSGHALALDLEGYAAAQSSVSLHVGPAGTANWSVRLRTKGTGDKVVQGWAEVVAPDDVSGTGVFTWTLGDGSVYEAAVPLAATSGNVVSLPFDNAKGYKTGLVLVNTDVAPRTVSFTAAGQNGSQQGSVTIPGRGHSAFVLTDKFPTLLNVTGGVQFSSDAPFLLLGLRFASTGAFTSLPSIH